MISNKEKRYEYWNHFIARYFVENVGGGKGITGNRLLRVQFFVLGDDNFWLDVIEKYNGLSQTPEQMMRNSKVSYNHCLDKFWGTIVKEMKFRGIINEL
jgi:hypothetical protein